MSTEVRHLAVRNPMTMRFGTYDTPAGQIRVACGAISHDEEKRLKRTLRSEFVTCHKCQNKIALGDPAAVDTMQFNRLPPSPTDTIEILPEPITS